MSQPRYVKLEIALQEILNELPKDPQVPIIQRIKDIAEKALS